MVPRQPTAAVTHSISPIPFDRLKAVQLVARIGTSIGRSWPLGVDAQGLDGPIDAAPHPVIARETRVDSPLGNRLLRGGDDVGFRNIAGGGRDVRIGAFGGTVLLDERVVWRDDSANPDDVGWLLQAMRAKPEPFMKPFREVRAVAMASSCREVQT